MLRWVLCLIVVVGVGCADGGGGAESVFAKAAPSVVVVLAQDSSGKSISQGSGIVVGAKMVVTDCRVIQDAAAVQIRQAADSQTTEPPLMNAELVAVAWDAVASPFASPDYSMNTRLASITKGKGLCLLYVSDMAPPTAKAAAMGEAQGLVVGEDVYAIGAPQGVDLSLSRGIVAQLHRDKDKAPIIKTDAAFSPGASGGGVFNKKGELVGVIAYVAQGENATFAMPIEDALSLIPKAKERIEVASRWQACVDNPQHQCILEFVMYVLQHVGLDDSTLSHVVRAQAEVKNIDEAKKIARQIEEVWWQGSAFRYIAVAQAEAGDISGAKQTAREAKNQASVLGGIAAVQAEAGDISGAKQTIADALQIAKKVGDDTWALNYIAMAQADIGDINGARQIAGQIKEEYAQNAALSHIFIAQMKLGDIDGARSNAQEIKDPVRQIYALSDIAAAQAEEDDMSGAKQTFARAKHIARLLEGNERFSHLGRIAWKQAEAGDTNGAKQIVFEYLPSAQRKHDAADSWSQDILLRYFIYAQAEMGKIEDAKQTARQLAPIYTDRILGNIARIQAKRGDVKGAKQTVVQIADNSKFAYPLGHIAFQQAKAGDISGALQTARMINDNGEMIETLGAIITILTK